MSQDIARVSPLTYTLDQLAEVFQWSEIYTRERLCLLRKKYGFPPKLPGCDRYSKPAVDDWFKANGHPDRQARATSGPALETIEEATRRLEAAIR